MLACPDLAWSVYGNQLSIQYNYADGVARAECSTTGGRARQLLFVDDASLVTAGKEPAQCVISLLYQLCEVTGMAANNTKCPCLRRHSVVAQAPTEDICNA